MFSGKFGSLLTHVVMSLAAMSTRVPRRRIHPSSAALRSKGDFDV